MKSSSRHLIDFILFASRWRGPLIVNTIITIIAAFIFVLVFAKKEYNAGVKFLPPVVDSGFPTDVMGISLAGLGSSNVLADQIEPIFATDALKLRIIEQFGFYRYFKIEKQQNRKNLAMMQMKKYLLLEIDKQGGMGFENKVAYKISCFHPSPDTVVLMANCAFGMVDSIVRTVTISRARRNRIFTEDQLTQNKMRLDSLEGQMLSFQTSNKAYNITEQMKLTFQVYGEMKANMLLNELKLKQLDKDYSALTPEKERLEKGMEVFREKLSQIEKDSLPQVLPSLNAGAKLYPQYMKLFKNIEVQTQLILYLSREYEQAKLQEAKDISPLIIIDPARKPDYKSRPKRFIMVGGIVAVEHFIIFILLLYLFVWKQMREGSPLFREFMDAFGKK
jgi:capsule polysaccharide export protein KpsE/RkpR